MICLLDTSITSSPKPSTINPCFSPYRIVLSSTYRELDTGSDGSLVPIAHLRQIFAPALTDTRIRSHWGEWRSVQLYVVDLELDGLRLPGVFVVGDEQGDEIVLGRNVLDKLRLLLNGPASLTAIPSQ